MDIRANASGVWALRRMQGNGKDIRIMNPAAEQGKSEAGAKEAGE